ncbi:ribosome maturation factor RimM [Clostridia bacterium]|nr:ribosome maturation factor RimM [Clostridia bacterium]
MEDLLQVGAITSPHGLKGEVKVFPTTDDPKRFLDLKKVLLDTGKEQIPLTITSVKFSKQMVILKFKQYNHINEIEGFKGKSLFVTREQAVPCEEDEYFIADLIGISAVTEEGEALGQIKDVLQTGANDVYVIAGESGKELLVPAIKDCVQSIDLKNKTITLRLLAGLRD